MTDILRQSDLKAASFCNGIKRHNQTFLIVELIKKSIAESRQITIQDIINVYLDNKFPASYSSAIGWWEDSNGKWVHYYCSRETFVRYKNNNHLEEKARGWFMQNLGAAIIKGKLLVIPIIEI
jgi:hypothetical protein